MPNNFAKLTLIKCMYIIIFIGISISMSSCTTEFMDTSSKISAPEIKEVPLQGRWKIERSLSSDSTIKMGDSTNHWIGVIVELGQNSLLLGKDYWEDINYKIKRVNAEEYFLHRIKDTQDKLGIKNGEIFVVSVSAQNKFLYEFVDMSKNNKNEVTEEEAIINIEDQYFYMKKLSNQISDRSNKQNGGKLSSRAEKAYEASKGGTSGILIGLRGPLNPDNTTKDIAENYSQKFRYRTLWISLKDFKLQPVLEAEDIFLPRISGFWKVGVKEKTKDNKTEEFLYAYSIPEGESKKALQLIEWSSFWINKEGVLNRTILYAGNDYVSIELLGNGVLLQGNEILQRNINSGDSNSNNNSTANSYSTNNGNSIGNNNSASSNNEKWKINMLQTLPVDNIESFKGIKLSDISGENGVLAMKSAIEKLIISSGIKNFSNIDEKGLEENFALFRKTGHWFFKGRVNFENNSIPSYQDYYINLIPPLRMVAYDELSIPWTYIKDRIPQTVDVYISPDNDIAIVLTRDALYIYDIIEGKLADAPLGKIQLNTGDTVVMAEWATGDYVDRWNNIFIKYNEVKNVKLESDYVH